MTFRAPEGTHDVLPDRAPLWRKLEEAARSCFGRYGYEEIRTPAFEVTQLFHKSSGETADVVEKEMYTFGDAQEPGGTFSLRPELTPGVIRALIEGDLFKKRGFWKVWYMGSAFRKERPQKGRYRQFTQFGVEAVGSQDPLVDAETMILFADLLGTLGISGWDLRINSMGCGACRGGYRDALRAAVVPALDKYCGNCRRRVERNVFRVLDCKVPGCVELSSGLPVALDHACAACKSHMAVVEGALGAAGVPYRVDPHIVRGLDYYTRTVYEFSSSKLGSQDAICGGGRYDTLVKDMGGPDVGSVGFAAGAERVLLLMDEAVPAPALDVYLVVISPELREKALGIVTDLRRGGLSGGMDFEGRSVKAQMREANRSGARNVLILGPEEAGRGVVKVKDMKGGAEREAAFGEIRSILAEGRR